MLESVISTNFSSIPVNQLGLNETDLPEQPQDAIGPNSPVFARSVAEVQQGLPWWKGKHAKVQSPRILLTGILLTAIAVEYANRYMLSAFCSWYSTGGAIPGVLNPLSSGTLNATGANPTDTGHIFEKFNATDVDAAGGGGEYEVVIGFVSPAVMVLSRLFEVTFAHTVLTRCRYCQLSGLDKRSHSPHRRRIRPIPCLPCLSFDRPRRWHRSQLNRYEWYCWTRQGWCETRGKGACAGLQDPASVFVDESISASRTISLSDSARIVAS